MYCYLVSCVCVILLTVPSIAAQPFTAEEQILVTEHVYGGLPSSGDLLVRHAFVMSYDVARRVPQWAAYHITPEYRDTPGRSGPFDDFGDDPDIINPVTNDDFDGFFGSRGYARGHMVPFAVLGGDRNDNGESAETDPYDSLTVIQGNYMSNITPQYHYGFNGSGGIWYEAERWLQDDIVDDQGRSVWEINGTVFGPQKLDLIGPNADIEVPPMFYKIVISNDEGADIPNVLAFLFPHHRKGHGDIEDYLVSVDVIEALTGLDFFQDLDDDIESGLEDRDTFENWSDF